MAHSLQNLVWHPFRVFAVTYSDGEYTADQPLQETDFALQQGDLDGGWWTFVAYGKPICTYVPHILRVEEKIVERPGSYGAAVCDGRALYGHTKVVFPPDVQPGDYVDDETLTPTETILERLMEAEEARRAEDREQQEDVNRETSLPLRSVAAILPPLDDQVDF